MLGAPAVKVAASAVVMVGPVAASPALTSPSAKAREDTPDRRAAQSVRNWDRVIPAKRVIEAGPG